MKLSSIGLIAFTLFATAALFAVVYFGGKSLVPSIASDIDQGDQTQFSKIAGERAPYFDLPDLAGDHTKLSQFDGTPLVLMFWATWDQRATDQVKILDDYVRVPNDLVQVIAINSQEERSIVSSFMRRGGYELTTLVDAYGATSEEYHVKSVPTFVFIDRAGLVREIYAGVLSTKAIGDKVENLLHY